jgi:branched-chain amino acid transport system ATP-binding protein
MLFRALDIHASYGEGEVLKGINIEVDTGEAVTLLGANGAGKTTLARVITGLTPLLTGRIEFNGEAIEATPATHRVRCGISMCPEGRKLFPQMTVLENLRLGMYLNPDRELMQKSFEDNFKLFPILEQRKSQLAGTLSGGEQQMLTLGRAMMSHPKLLILDEPSLGLAPLVIENIYRVIAEIESRGTTLLIVEQNASIALGISKRGYVLETGKIALEGTREELLNNPRIKEAYLGG